MLFLVKTIVSALLIAGISEIAKKHSLAASLLAALPLTSIMVMLWINVETQDKAKIIEMSYMIFWMIIPSFAFFLLLPALMKKDINFYLSLLISSAITAVIYIAAIYLYHKVKN